MFFFFFFNDTATTEIYTLSLHDALPISTPGSSVAVAGSKKVKPARSWSSLLMSERPEISRVRSWNTSTVDLKVSGGDRKSTRLNSSHANISYAVFCLKKKKKNI